METLEDILEKDKVEEAFSMKSPMPKGHNDNVKRVSKSLADLKNKLKSMNDTKISIKK